MRIAETVSTPLPLFRQQTAMPQARPASDVSREERLQLLTEKRPPRSTTTAAATYSERAQLLAASGPHQHSWVV